MELLLGIIGTLITVISFIYAIYVNKRYNKLENINREESWEIYRQSSNVLGFFQKIDELNIDNRELIKLNAQGERSATELTVSSIKMIKRIEKVYDEKTIEKWAQKGKLINETHIQTFKSFVS